MNIPSWATSQQNGFLRYSPEELAAARDPLKLSPIQPPQVAEDHPQEPQATPPQEAPRKKRAYVRRK